MLLDFSCVLCPNSSRLTGFRFSSGEWVRVEDPMEFYTHICIYIYVYIIYIYSGMYTHLYSFDVLSFPLFSTHSQQVEGCRNPVAGENCK